MSYYRIFCILLFLIIIIRPVTIIYSQWDFFSSRGYEKGYLGLESAYYSSQYTTKGKHGIMPDESFESYLGGAFLKGVNPIMRVHEHPPLGRYIIALSILLFDNAKTLIIPLTIISTIGIFLISKLILKKVLFSLIPLAIFINEPLFINKFYFAPLLEPIQQSFIVFALYFFIKGLIDKKYAKWFVLASIMLGFVISIRFFALGAALLLTMVISLFLEKTSFKKVTIFFLSLPLSLVVLILSYTRTLQSGYSVFQIFSIQKYMLFYHKSQLISPLSFWDLILFNRWHAWWGERIIISDPHWNFFWPLAVVLTIIFLLSTLFKKLSINKEEKVVLLWVITYSSLLSIGNTTTRYFLPLLPFFYILATSFVINFLTKLKLGKK